MKILLGYILRKQLSFYTKKEPRTMGGPTRVRVHPGNKKNVEKLPQTYEEQGKHLHPKYIR